MAEAWVSLQGPPEYPGDEYNIEEWELDPGVAESLKNYSAFTVTMLRNGDVELVENLGSPLGVEKSIHILTRSKYSYMGGEKPEPDCIQVVCHAKSLEHAVKIANEKRTEKIANGEWN